ncbi:MAG: 2-polyprenylphenol 6-hydroxylase [Gammaproteobacteria bacterium]|nr:2-polyprenylphenol 6-hydroxylase [Gammaproteobacteria bacterium]|tara:strand:+ start:2018 stop:3667 length:1650 start_codon:yes stop_codon:yes gene_type:complete
MLNNFIRVIQITRLFIKYDVDKMLVNCGSGKCRFYFYMLPWNWFRKRKVDNIPLKIRMMFEELGPIFVKLGQVISTRKDLLPNDVADELSKLQDRVKPFPEDISMKIIENELGNKISNLFNDFKAEPLASASIAQVHAAQLKNGKDVIIKVVRPGIHKAIKKDLLLMKKIAEFLTSLSDDFKRMHLIEVVNDYELLVYDETDLIKESTNAKKIRDNFQGSKLIYIPEIYWDYVTKNILVMERIYETPINDKAELLKKGINFEKLAKNAVESFFIQVFEHNFFHADMHPGNIFVKKIDDDVQFILVDFGIMGSLSKFDKRYLAENFVAFFNRDYEKVARLHVECEWVPKDTNISLLEKAIRDNCESMLDKSIKDVSLSDIILGLFDTARKFKLEVQPQLILMQKALLYTEGLGREFHPELDLWKTSKPILEKWMKKQKGLSSVVKNLKNNYSDMVDLLPELPSALRKIINLLNNDQLNLDRNLEKLNQIEKSIFKSTRRNYWMTASLIFTLFVIISTYFYLNNLYIINHPIYLYMVLLSILIIVMRPRKK